MKEEIQPSTSEYLDQYDIEHMEPGEKRVITTEHHRPHSDYVFTKQVIIKKVVVDSDILLSFFSGVVNGSGCTYSISQYEDGKHYDVGDKYDFDSSTIRYLKNTTYEECKNTHHKCFLKHFTYVAFDDETNVREYAVNCSETEYIVAMREDKLKRILDERN